MRTPRDRFLASPCSLVLALGLAAHGYAGCVPATEEDLAGVDFNTPIPTDMITEAEQAAGAGDPGNDQVEPWDGIDGPVANLAPSATDDGLPNTRVDDPISQAVQADTACRAATGYRSGRAVTICVTTVDGKLVERHTAAAYLRMKAAASRAGVGLYVVSGFRTMERQRELYNCWQRRVPGCNLAARPGYSNHQSGTALDLNTRAGGVYRWLTAHAREYGFRRTVPSEAWHWEYNGSTSTGPTPEARSCHSTTLNRVVGLGTCVESRSDSRWYQCVEGTWRAGQNVSGPCTASYPLARGNSCFSQTLGRNMVFASCVQSSADRRWYQCTGAGWVPDENITRSGNGPAGACASRTPL